MKHSTIRLLLLLSALAVTSAAQAQSLADFLDRSFGTDGLVTSAHPGTPYGVAVSGSGRIVVVAIDTTAASGYHVARYLPDGTLDTAFGSGGLVSIPHADAYVSADDLSKLTVLVQPDERTLIATRRREGDQVRGLLVRLTPDGGLDTSFGTAGWLLLDHAVTDLELMPDGRLLVALQGTSPNDPEAARFHPDGTPDATFGEGGFADFSPSVPDFRAFAFAPAGDFLGSLWLAGIDDGDGTSHPAVVRLTDAGAPDPYYGSGGINVDSLRQTDHVADVAFDLFLRTTLLYRSEAMGLNRLFGITDATFGAGGAADIGPPGTQPRALTVLPDGSILAVGDEALALLDRDGQPDPAFGADGWIASGWQALAAQPDAQVVLAGGSPGMWTLARIAIDPPPGGDVLDASFGSGGVVTRELGGSWDRGRRTLELEDGKLLTVGDVTLGLSGAETYGVVLTRSLPDGAPDLSFGMGGRMYLTVDPAFTFAPLADAAQLPNGDVLLTVTAQEPSVGRELLILRLTPDGERVASFGENGTARFDLNDDDLGGGLLVQPDGSFFVSVYAGTGGDPPSGSLLRYLPDGTLDPDFGTDGVREFVPGFVWGRLTQHPDGDFLFSGAWRPGDSGVSQLAIARLNTDGTLDPSFGQDGLALLEEEGWIGNLAVLSDGRIMVSGITDQSPYRAFLARFSAGGVLDPDFGDGGLLLPIEVNKSDQIISGVRMRVLPGDRLLFAGSSMSGGLAPGFRIVVGVLTADGDPDPAFADGGWLALDLNVSAENIHDLTLLADGHALLIGNVQTPEHDLLLVKFDPGRAPVATEPDAVSEELGIAVYPNPSRDVVQFRFALARPGPVTLDLFDLLGRRVAQISDGHRASGPHSVVWPTRDLPSGVYIVRIATPDGLRTQRLTVVR